MDEKTLNLSGWRVIRVIGKGSFGKVYEIEKEDEFGGGVRSALKVISIPESSAEIEAYRDDGYDDESLTKLFRSRVEDITSEFRLMNKLKGCSNIVSYEDHAVVQHENDIGYDIMIRMELLTPLPKFFDQRAGRDAIGENTVRRLGADICRALELCGRCHIIHRDIKPQNIFVSELGDFKLGDFGIAKTSDHTTKATKTGTYGYMAPEVYLSKPYNASVDLYSLGIVLYWMLNERRGPFLPLPPEVPTPTQTAEALERRMHGEPLPAPKNGSEELKRIVLKACAYDPKDRYASPAEMRRDLERALAVSAAEVPAEPTVMAQEASEATVSLFTGKEAPTRDENATVGLFEKKEIKKPISVKTPEKTVNKIEKPAAHTETVPKQEPQKPKKRKKKNVLPVILAAAMLAIAAAIVLVIVLSSRTDAAQKMETEAIPTPETTEKPTPEVSSDEISVVAVTSEPEETPEPVSGEELAYSAALALFEEGKYEEAIAAFEALNGYLDSAEQIEACKLERDYTSAVALYEAEEYKNAIPELIKIRDYKDSNAYLLACWDHVAERKTIGAGPYLAAAVKRDGTVLAAGTNDYGPYDVSDWTDIIAISVGYNNIAGLRANGTTVVVGNNKYGQCDVSNWTDIVAISAGRTHTVGLKADGTVVAVGLNWGQCEVSDWTDIVAIAAGGAHTVGLRSDGTVVAVGWNRYDQCDVSGWTDIVAIIAGNTNTLGLQDNGTVLAIGENEYGKNNVTKWKNVIEIATADQHSTGLKSDGTVEAVGSNIHGQCNVEDWTDIVEIAAGGSDINGQTIGLKLNGTVVIAGRNAYGAHDVSDWTDIMLPNEGRRVPGPINEAEPEPQSEATEPQTEKSFSDYAPTINMSFEELVGSLNDFDESNPNSNESFRMPYGYPAADTYRIVVDFFWQTVMVYTKDKNGEYTVPVRYMPCSTGDKIKTGVYKMNETRVRFGNYANGTSAQYWSMIYDRTYFVSTLYSKYRDLSSVDKESYLAIAAGIPFSGTDGIRLSVPDARWIFYNICYDTEIEIRKGSQNDTATGEIRAKLQLAPWKDDADLSVANTPYTDNWRLEDISLEAVYVHTTPKPTPTPSSSQSKIGKVIASQVALRKQPDKNSECIEEYSKGEVVTILNTAKDSDGRKWYYVKTSDGKKGYIVAEYVKIISG